MVMLMDLKERMEEAVKADDHEARDDIRFRCEDQRRLALALREGFNYK